MGKSSGRRNPLRHWVITRRKGAIRGREKAGRIMRHSAGKSRKNSISSGRASKDHKALRSLSPDMQAAAKAKRRIHEKEPSPCRLSRYSSITFIRPSASPCVRRSRWEIRLCRFFRQWPRGLYDPTQSKVAQGFIEHSTPVWPRFVPPARR